jgi:hypothetical protein
MASIKIFVSPTVIRNPELLMKVTRAPSKNASLVGQGIGVRVGVSVGKGVSVGSSSVGVFVGDGGNAVAVLVGDGGNVVAVTGMGLVVLSGEGKVLIASVSTTSVVAVGSPCEHETRQTHNIPIHNHLMFHLATIIVPSLSRLG